MPADQLLLFAFGLAFIGAVAVAVAFATSRAYRAGAAAGAAEERGSGPRTSAPVDPLARPTHRPRAAAGASACCSSRPPARARSPASWPSCSSRRWPLVVALTRAWPDREPAIFTLAGGGHVAGRAVHGHGAVVDPGALAPPGRGHRRGRLPGPPDGAHRRCQQPLPGGFLPGGRGYGAVDRRPGAHCSSLSWRQPPSRWWGCRGLVRRRPRAAEAWPGSASAPSRSSCSPTSPPPPPERIDRPATRPCAPRASMP